MVTAAAVVAAVKLLPATLALLQVVAVAAVITPLEMRQLLIQAQAAVEQETMAVLLALVVMVVQVIVVLLIGHKEINNGTTLCIC
jgi:hypothetical protein